MSEHKSFDLSDLSFLIVEDNKHMQMLLREIFRSFNVEMMECAEDGADALKTLKSFDPDIIISDWEMMPLDGIDFVTTLRRDPESRNPMVPVIMVTAHAEFSRVIEARDAGVNEFLVKPVAPRMLYGRIVEIIERPRRFVRNGDRYVGPDRRRNVGDIMPYEGLERRTGSGSAGGEAKPPSGNALSESA